MYPRCIRCIHPVDFAKVCMVFSGRYVSGSDPRFTQPQQKVRSRHTVCNCQKIPWNEIIKLEVTNVTIDERREYKRKYMRLWRQSARNRAKERIYRQNTRRRKYLAELLAERRQA